MKKVKKLPQNIQEHIKSSLTRIQVRPFEFLGRLTKYLYFKLRVVDYRLIVDVINEDLLILVIEVGHRKNIYQ